MDIFEGDLKMNETAQMEAAAVTGEVKTAAEPSQTAEIPAKKGIWKHRKKEKDNRRFTKKKFPTGKIILILVVLGICGFIYSKMTSKGPTGFPVSSVPLEKGDLISAVNLTGTIESAADAQVYAKTSGILESVTVEVGDKVEAGQVLAQLDTRDLRIEVAQKQIAIEEKQRQAAQAQLQDEFNINSADKDFDAERVDVAAGLNQKLISAENEVDRAQKALNAARREYNTYKDDHDLADTVFKRAQRKLENASDAYRKALVELEEAKASGDATEISKLTKLVEDTQKAYDTANDEYNAADREYGSQMSLEAKAYRDARSDYEQALKNRDAAKNAIARELDNLKDNVTKAEITAQLEPDYRADYLSIESAQQKIADSTVTAPISGTVTAVYAEKGAQASGLLFIIEDTENLVVKTAVKELDVGKVKPDMKAEVKADATGERVFPGVVQTISPTAAKDANGKTVTSGNVEFETDVALEESSDLRVGMNVRVNVVTEQKKGVWSAPFDAVISDASGQSIIYTVETDAEGVSRAKSVPVTTGMETDFYVEISGEGLKDGMPIISDPSMIQEGMEVLDTSAAAAAADGTAAADDTAVTAG